MAPRERGNLADHLVLVPLCLLRDLFEILRSHFLEGVVRQELLDEIHVSHEHPPAAVSIQSQGIQRIPSPFVPVQSQEKKQATRRD